MSICTGCGVEFKTTVKQKRRCKPNCNRRQSPDRHKAEQTTKFIGVDGEGVTLESGEHRYVLLSVGDRSLHRDGTHLSIDEILTFLWDCFLEKPGSAYVGFYLGYDFTQWLRTLPQNRAAMLLSTEGIEARQPKNDDMSVPFPVRYGEWEIDILGKVRFKMRRRGAKRWLNVCDSGPFWQCSFMKAIDPQGWVKPIVTDGEYAVIAEGKSKRATAEFDTDMIRYNVTENAILARVMGELDAGFRAAGLTLKKSQWFGPGQAAQLWLDHIEAPTAEWVNATVPDYALDAGRRCYYGGWFEIMYHGIIAGKSYEYDLNSAYPWVIANLPCLCGEWTRGEGSIRLDSAYTMVYAEILGDKTIGPMPHRLSNGGILRPSHTMGWYWAHELRAAKRAGLLTAYHIHEWIKYRKCGHRPPIRAISGLYESRLQVGKNSAQGKAFKLLYNSAYGKFAQTVGNPRYSNPIYASLITAGCRTRILEAIASHPDGADGVLMVATDGIYFKNRHPSLELSSTVLGAWDETELENLTLFMPGVYWHDESRRKIAEGKTAAFKSRGINANDLAAQISIIDNLWRMFDGTEWPSMSISVAFSMVSAKLAIARGKWHTAGQVSAGDNRTINSDPAAKRCDVELSQYGWSSKSWIEATTVETYYYDKRFAMPDDMNPEMLTDARDINSLFAEALYD